MQRLKHRQDFVAAAKGLFAAMPGMVVQVLDRRDDGAPRVGFTVTKKQGNAVARNRIKRRLREVTRLHLGEQARTGFDYVLIGRAQAITRDFSDLQKDLHSALQRLHRKPHETGA